MLIFLKATIQVLTSIIGILFFLPVIILFGIVVFIEDGKPLFFIQNRVGKQKKIFKIYKIRTLKIDTPSVGSHLIGKNAVLMSGKLSRKFKIDEFPQLINVIKGDLNLVGPRPCLENQEDLIAERQVLDIFSIKPGITGLGQVLKYDMKEPKLLAMVDKIFIDNDSMILRLKILISTFSKFYRNDLQKLVDQNLKYF